MNDELSSARPTNDYINGPLVNGAPHITVEPSPRPDSGGMLERPSYVHSPDTSPIFSYNDWTKFPATTPNKIISDHSPSIDGSQQPSPIAPKTSTLKKPPMTPAADESSSSIFERQTDAILNIPRSGTMSSIEGKYSNISEDERLKRLQSDLDQLAERRRLLKEKQEKLLTGIASQPRRGLTRTKSSSEIEYRRRNQPPPPQVLPRSSSREAVNRIRRELYGDRPEPLRSSKSASSLFNTSQPWEKLDRSKTPSTSRTDLNRTLSEGFDNAKDHTPEKPMAKDESKKPRAMENGVHDPPKVFLKRSRSLHITSPASRDYLKSESYIKSQKFLSSTENFIKPSAQSHENSNRSPTTQKQNLAFPLHISTHTNLKTDITSHSPAHSEISAVSSMSILNSSPGSVSSSMTSLTRASSGSTECGKFPTSHAQVYESSDWINKKFHSIQEDLSRLMDHSDDLLEDRKPAAERNTSRPEHQKELTGLSRSKSFSAGSPAVKIGPRNGLIRQPRHNSVLSEFHTVEEGREMNVGPNHNQRSEEQLHGSQPQYVETLKNLGPLWLKNPGAHPKPVSLRRRANSDAAAEPTEPRSSPALTNGHVTSAAHTLSHSSHHLANSSGNSGGGGGGGRSSLQNHVSNAESVNTNQQQGPESISHQKEPADGMWASNQRRQMPAAAATQRQSNDEYMRRVWAELDAAVGDLQQFVNGTYPQSKEDNSSGRPRADTIGGTRAQAKPAPYYNARIPASRPFPDAPDSRRQMTKAPEVTVQPPNRTSSISRSRSVYTTERKAMSNGHTNLSSTNLTANPAFNKSGSNINDSINTLRVDTSPLAQRVHSSEHIQKVAASSLPTQGFMSMAAAPRSTPNTLGIPGNNKLRSSLSPIDTAGTPMGFYSGQQTPLEPYNGAEKSDKKKPFGDWYQPDMSREEITRQLTNKPVGSFLIRDSTSYPGFHGLALKVQQSNAASSPSDLVRHFLIETSTRGVRVKGHAAEPFYDSLASLVAHHCEQAISLPCKLILPQSPTQSTPSPSLRVPGADAVDVSPLQLSGRSGSTETNLTSRSSPNTGSTHSSNPAAVHVTQALPQTTAACVVVYLTCCEVESLTGAAAIERAMLVRANHEADSSPPVIVHFRLDTSNITISDLSRKLFFRKCIPLSSLLYCGVSPSSKTVTITIAGKQETKSVFGLVVAGEAAGGNECWLFTDYEQDQSAASIVTFVRKVANLTTTQFRH